MDNNWTATLIASALATLHLACAVSVTLHCLLRKDSSNAAVAWIALSWLAPVWGSLGYLFLGVNRIARKGAALELDRSCPGSTAYLLEKDHISWDQALAATFPSLVGLAKLGAVVTDRPILPANLVEPLINGDEAFPAMLQAIDAATKSVTLSSYIFDNDRIGQQFLDRLTKAATRGVSVRVLIDFVGSRYSKPSMPALLRPSGISVATFLPPGKVGMFRYANLRNHRKILVVDGQTGFTGGTNIRESHMLGLSPTSPSQCVHFRLGGPVVTHLQEVFAVDWAFATGERLMGNVWFDASESTGEVLARGISGGPDRDLDKMPQVLLGALTAARDRVRIVTPYFLPDDALLWALAVAAMRDVKIDIVIPEKSNILFMDWAVVPQLPLLLEKGCRIYRSPLPFDHSKLLVVDGLWSLIGSTNWDARSLRLNFEFNVECYDQHLGARLDRIAEEKIAAGRRMTLREVLDRSIPVRLRDGLCRLLSPYL